jgi:hypothetical protein
MGALVYCLACLWIVSPIIRSMMEGVSRYDRPSHQVYMYFFLRSGWQVQFLEPDLKTPLPRKLTFKDPQKIRELAKQGGAWRDSDSQQILEHAIEAAAVAFTRGSRLSNIDAWGGSEADADQSGALTVAAGSSFEWSRSGIEPRGCPLC